jgi:integrase/recombinase XerD
MSTANETASLGALLQSYFCDRLINQRGASPCTVTSYRDAFRLVLQFAEAHYHKSASDLLLADLNADFVSQFLRHLETSRHNSIRSRNARLAAIHAFARYAALKDPGALPIMQGVLAIPDKRFDRAMIHALSREEIIAILDAPDATTWSGRRDRALLAVLYNTGARVSEVARVRRGDLQLLPTGRITLHGKGRKERVIPLWKQTARILKPWLTEIDPDPAAPLFPNRHGIAITRSGIENRLKVAVLSATVVCPSLRDHHVSPHVIRHTTAMHLLESGVDITVIALWLGHESIETTHQYVEANMAMKEKALGAMRGSASTVHRYKPPKDILAYLDDLRYAE